MIGSNDLALATESEAERVQMRFLKDSLLKTDGLQLSTATAGGLRGEKIISTVASRDRVLHSLDALRGIAALGVVVYHFHQYFSPVSAPGGYLAVDLFFMLSGVVITRAYGKRFAAGMSTGEFMLIRLIRLYPLYALGTALGLAAAIASLHGNNLDHWRGSTLSIAALLAVFMIPNFTGHPNERLFPLNAPCWSLFLEILVNLLFGALWTRLTTRRLLAVAAVAALALGASLLHFGDVDQGFTFATLLPGLARTIYGFSVGVLIGRGIGPGPRRTSVALFLVICATLAASILGRPEGTHRELWDGMCVFLVFPAVVYAGTLVEPPAWLRPVATGLGVTSYAVYALHAPLLSVVDSFLRRLYHGDTSGGAPYVGIVVLAALLGGCWLVDRYYDSPVRRRLSASQRRQAAAG